MKRSQLDAPSYQALLAGRHLEVREHWLAKARDAKLKSAAATDVEERQAHADRCALRVAFAKSAHRAYLNELGRSLRYQRRAAHQRAIATMSAAVRSAT